MGNTNSTEGNNLVASYQQQQQQQNQQSESQQSQRRSRSSSSSSIKAKPIQTNSSSSTASSSSATHDIEHTSDHWTPKEPVIQEDLISTNTKEIPINIKMNNNKTNEEIKPATPTKKSGWVSSTGQASPWYGSLSSSASSHHRASISGPYYRTRGMSVTRDNETDEVDFSSVINTPLITQPSTTGGVPTIITWTQGGNNVYVTGTFNGWKHKIKLVKSTHDFSAVLELPAGTHRLKFIVDDEWKCSNEMETATDPDGNLVNYLQVLEDEEQACDEESEDQSSHVDTDTYSNVIPPELLQEEAQKKAPQPPSLPPHLEKVLLNSNTVSEEDNSILHEPNHVTLNHLYACSIKDNVMALATTSRYRKKYVTTMYYRPVFPKN